MLHKACSIEKDYFSHFKVFRHTVTRVCHKKGDQALASKRSRSNSFAAGTLGSPISGSPVSGSPISGSPISGSPISGSPISEGPCCEEIRHLLLEANAPVKYNPHNPRVMVVLRKSIEQIFCPMG